MHLATTSPAKTLAAPAGSPVLIRLRKTRLADVRQVSALAERHDLWAAFYAFGISRRSTGRRVGLLNPPENIALQCGRSMQMRERGLAPDDYLSIGVGD